jgi:hypothetical protein
MGYDQNLTFNQVVERSNRSRPTIFSLYNHKIIDKFIRTVLVRF